MPPKHGGESAIVPPSLELACHNRTKHLVMSFPSDEAEDHRQDDRVNNVAMHYDGLRHQGTDAKERQICGGEGAGRGYKQKGAGYAFGYAGEIAEPLSKPDLIEFIDHLLHAEPGRRLPQAQRQTCRAVAILSALERHAMLHHLATHRTGASSTMNRAL
jgi:hypothetical protein